MGANCTNAVPSLLRGCIDAYKNAVTMRSSRHTGIAKTAKGAIKALAGLSEREKSRVRGALAQDGILVGLQLEFAVNQDRISAVCLLLQHLASQCNDKELPGQVTNRSNRDELSLRTVLQQTPALLTSTITFLKEQALMITTEGEGLDQRIGWSCLLIRCWAWVVIRCDIMLAFKDSCQDELELLASLVSTLQALGEVIQGTPETDSKSTETPLTLLLCASILTQARLSFVDSADETVVRQCSAWVKKCFEYRSRHLEYGTVVARIACFLKSRNVKAFRRFVQDVLNDGKFSGDCYTLLPSELEHGVLNSWELIGDTINFDSFFKGKLDASIPQNTTALIDFVKYADSNSTEGLTDSLKSCLVEHIGGKAIECRQPDPKMPELITRAAAYFAKHTTINLPLFSPLQLEISASKLRLHELKSQLSEKVVEFNTFYLVLYWFAFIETSENSIFKVDLRILPLKEMLSFCRQRSKPSPQDGSPLALYFEYFVSKHCPETPGHK